MERVTEVNDPRLDPYRNLKQDKYLAGSDYFIAEGRFVVERLISSQFEIQSLLISSGGFSDLKGIDSLRSPMFQVSRDVCEQLVGFPFHRGIMACGKRKVRRCYEGPDSTGSALLVCCPDTVLAENLGVIIRTSAALGAQAVLTGRGAIDPFSRRAIRTSMGNCFQVPIIQSQDLIGELARLKSECRFETIGLTLNQQAISITEIDFSRRTILLLGNEGFGLRPEYETICDRYTRIAMADGVDSLNVASAAAIAMFTFKQSLLRY